MNRNMITMGVMLFGSKVVNLADPNVLNVVRAVYLALAMLYWQTYSGMEAKVPEDDTVIWVPVVQKKGMMDTLLGAPDAAPKEWKKTTMKEHEVALAKEKGGAAFMKAAQPFFMSQVMGFHVVLLLNILNLPLDLYDDPLAKKYVLGVAVARPYGELYRDPAAGGTGPALTDGTGALVEGGSAGAGGVGVPGSRDTEYEEAIFRTWESSDPVQIPIFEQLISVGGKDPNYGTADQGWTALAVVAGSPQNGRRELIRLLELGCRPESSDRDGWNAVHWAAHHASSLAVRVLVSAYGVDLPDPSAGKGPRAKVPVLGDADALRSLLKAVDAKGRTPEAVAREASNATDATGEQRDDGQEVAALLADALGQATAVCKAEGAAGVASGKRGTGGGGGGGGSAAGTSCRVVKTPLSKDMIASLLRTDAEGTEDAAAEGDAGSK